MESASSSIRKPFWAFLKPMTLRSGISIKVPVIKSSADIIPIRPSLILQSRQADIRKRTPAEHGNESCALQVYWRIREYLDDFH